MPVNLRSHGHGQGYLDLNFLIPELVQTISYRKGPYSVEAGDFSTAGSSAFTTYDVLPASFAEVSVGENGFRRGVAAASLDAGPGHLLIAAEAQAYDGPWVLEQDLTKLNGLIKYAAGGDAFSWGVTLMAYDSEWTSTDQVPLRAIESGRIDRLGFIDPDLGGSTTRTSAIVNARWTSPGGAVTTLDAYASSYDFQLFSNFTYRLDDPVEGDEFEQVDQRQVYGARLRHERALRLGTLTGRLRLGAEGRIDDVGDVGLFETAARRRTDTVRRDEVVERSAALLADAELDLTDRLRLGAGLRGDAYEAEVTGVSLPANSGAADDAILSPNARLAYRAADGLELYASYGRGFHSNDARGATISMDPASGEAADRVPLLVRAKGAELGARLERGRFTGTLAGFRLDLDSELVFVGDAGDTEASGATRRYGVEATAFWRPTDWLVLDVGGSYTDAAFTDVSSDEDEIPGAIETVVSGGAVARWRDLTGSVRLRRFGEAPLKEDGSVRSEPTTVVNAGASYALEDWTITLDVLNVLGSEDADITYFYGSRLAGEPSEVEDVHLHPVEPRQLRAALRRTF